MSLYSYLFRSVWILLVSLLASTLVETAGAAGSGTTRLSGLVDMSRLGEEGILRFDCLFIIDLWTKRQLINTFAVPDTC